MKNLVKKFRHLIMYGIFGVLTTIVNIAVYWICTRLFALATVPATAIAWFIAVLFAYVTNRAFVFGSGADGKREVLIECAKFFAFRAATGVLDVAIMYVCVDIFGFNDVLIKVISNVVVIVFNYLASRLVVFKGWK